jgi:hypothetical protein
MDDFPILPKPPAVKQREGRSIRPARVPSDPFELPRPASSPRAVMSRRVARAEIEARDPIAEPGRPPRLRAAPPVEGSGQG